MLADPLLAQAECVLDACRRASLRLVIAESCTGGLLAGALTALPGSSEVVERGFVVYSNEAKEDLLGVPHGLLLAQGAVSDPVVRAMAEGALARTPLAALSIAVTGIAGPGGATPAKPVGLVFIASARRDRATLSERHVFAGDRQAVRLAAVAQALNLLLKQAA